MPESERLQWQPRTVDTTAPDALSRSHRLPHLVARVLAARGWQPGEALHTFLEAPSQAEPDYTQLIGVPEASARLVIADPPYFRVLTGEVWDNQWADEAEYLEWSLRWMRLAMRDLMPGGLLYCFAPK